MPVFPGIPYGPAAAWVFPAFELSMYVLLAVCVRDALRPGARRGSVWYLLGGLMFGLSLEYLEVLSGSYSYGHFGLMLGRAPMDIPVCIGCGWAIILYTSRLFSDWFQLPWAAAAALDTLLALNLDLSMDVVAYRLHMWHWYWDGSGLNPMRAQWFGVPYGNFIGWITVVFGYSFFSRALERRLACGSGSAGGSGGNGGGGWKFVGIMLLAIVCAQAVLIGTESAWFHHVYEWLHLPAGRRLALFSAVLLAIAAAGWRRRGRDAVGGREPRVPRIAVWVPEWFHVFFVAIFFAFGFYRESVWMTVIGCGNAALGVAVHVAAGRMRAAGAARV